MVSPINKVKIEIDGVTLSGGNIDRARIEDDTIFVVNTPALMPQKESIEVVELARKHGIKSVLLHPYYESIFLGIATGLDVIEYMFKQGLITLETLEGFIRSKKIGGIKP